MLFTKGELKKVIGAQCNRCEIHRTAQRRNIKPTGKGELNTLIVTKQLEWTDDNYNRHMTGPNASWLIDILKSKGFDPLNDFWFTTALSCYTDDNVKDRFLDYCNPNLLETINKLNPKYIMVFGIDTLNQLTGRVTDKMSSEKFRGRFIPDLDLKKYIIPNFSLDKLIEKEYDQNIMSVFERDIEKAAHTIKNDLLNDIHPHKENLHLLYNYNEVTDYLDHLIEREPLNLCIDYEATGLKPYRKGHRIVTVSFCSDIRESYAFPFQYADYFDKDQIESIRLKLNKIFSNPNIQFIGQNIKFEECWTRKIIGCETANWKWDTLLATHVLDSRSGICGLKLQTYLNFGIKPYDDDIKKYLDSGEGEFNLIDKAPLSKLLEYNAKDTLYTLRLHKKQLQQFRQRDRSLLDAYKLLHDGSLAFADMQGHGVDINEKYYVDEEKKLDNLIAKIHEEMLESDEAKLFRDRYNRPIQISSAANDDIRNLIYNVLRVPEAKTEAGNLKCDKKVLESIDSDFIRMNLRLRKLGKLRGTYLAQLKREVCYGKMHPFFDLHIPVSYRSSSSMPNFQNFPKRDKESWGIVRSGMIPSLGFRLMEFDYSGVEVSCGACYHKDPNMIKYLTDPTTDMHRDTAADVWAIEKDEISDDIRFFSKNCWVFPQFYGSYYGNCATDLWANCLHLETNSGVVLQDHLRGIGIKNFEDFRDHCQDVENIFWGERFPVYDQWRKDQNDFYLKNGYIKTLTGFECGGRLSYKDVANHNVQGSAFHWLLWSIIEINKKAKEENWDSRLIGQIHDAGISNTHPDEVIHVMNTVKDIMTVQIRKKFPWIIVPLKVDFELGEIDAPWTEVKKVKSWDKTTIQFKEKG